MSAIWSATGIEPVGEGNQRSTQVQSVGRLDHFRASYGRRPDDDIDDHRVDLDVVVDVDAGEGVAPRRYARLVFPKAGRHGPDQAEGEVVSQINLHQYGQCPLCLREVGGAQGCEVHIFGSARARYPGEHAHPALEQPLGVLALGEDAGEEPVEASSSERQSTYPACSAPCRSAIVPSFRIRVCQLEQIVGQ